MADLNQIELQHLRHLIGAHETAYQKLNTYSSQAVDPQIKQLFSKSAQDALNTKQKLLSFFNFENSNTDPSENLSSQSKVNLNFLFSYDGTTYNVFIKNIYLFSNSVFLPSYLTIDNSGKYTSFDQDDLG